MESPENTKLTSTQLANLKDKFEKLIQIDQNNNSVLIGYYPFRGKAQVIRLLCQYLKINYENIFFSPKTWQQYRQRNRNQFTFQDMPFIKDGNIVISQTIPSCLYLIQKYGNPDLVGKTIRDKTIVDMFIWAYQMLTNVLAVYCKKMEPGMDIQIYKEQQWVEHFSKRMEKYQSYAVPDNWYLGYISIIDFQVYELIYYISRIYPKKLSFIPKLTKIQQRVGNIPQIKQYESSNRAIKDGCPIKYFTEFRMYYNYFCQQKTQ